MKDMYTYSRYCYVHIGSAVYQLGRVYSTKIASLLSSPSSLLASRHCVRPERME